MPSGKSIKSWSVVSPAEELNKGSSSGAVPPAFQQQQAIVAPPSPVDFSQGIQQPDTQPSQPLTSVPQWAQGSQAAQNLGGIGAPLSMPLPPAVAGQSLAMNPQNQWASGPEAQAVFADRLRQDQLAALQEQQDAAASYKANQDQGFLATAGRNFVSGAIGSVAAPLTTLTEKAGTALGSKSMLQRAGDLRSAGTGLGQMLGDAYEYPEATAWEKITDPKWYATVGAQTMGSGAGSMALSAAAAVPVSILAEVLAPVALAYGVAESVVGIGIAFTRFAGGAGTDALLEMGSAYNDARVAGKSIEQANEIANQVGVDNLKLSVLLEGAGLGGKGIKKLSSLVLETGAAKRIVASAPVRSAIESQLLKSGISQKFIKAGHALTDTALEVGEEFFQERQQGEIQKAAEQNRPWDLVRGATSSEYNDDGLGAALMVLGGKIVGGGFAITGKLGAKAKAQNLGTELAGGAGGGNADEEQQVVPAEVVPSRRALSGAAAEAEALQREEAAKAARDEAALLWNRRVKAEADAAAGIQQESPVKNNWDGILTIPLAIKAEKLGLTPAEVEGKKTGRFWTSAELERIAADKATAAATPADAGATPADGGAAGTAPAGADQDAELRKEIIQFLVFNPTTGEPRVFVPFVDTGMKDRAAFENFAKQMKAKYSQAEIFKNNAISTASGQVAYALNQGSQKYGNMFDEATKINLDTRVKGLLDAFGYKAPDRNAEQIDPKRTYDAAELNALAKIYSDAKEVQRKSDEFYAANPHMIGINENKRDPGRAGNVATQVRKSVEGAAAFAKGRYEAAVRARGAATPAGTTAPAGTTPANPDPASNPIRETILKEIEKDIGKNRYHGITHFPGMFSTRVEQEEIIPELKKLAEEGRLVPYHKTVVSGGGGTTYTKIELSDLDAALRNDLRRSVLFQPVAAPAGGASASTTAPAGGGGGGGTPPTGGGGGTTTPEPENFWKANLSGRDFSGRDLTGRDMTGANLTGAKLNDVNFFTANLHGANLTNADLKGAMLNGANLSGAILTDANFEGAFLTGAYTLDGAGKRIPFVAPASSAPAGATELQRKEDEARKAMDDAAKRAMERAKEEAATQDYSDQDITGMDLSGKDLTRNKFTNTTMTGAKLAGANLTGVDLTGAYMRGANLTGATLTNADLRGANLLDANLSGAELSGADFESANLSGANFEGAELPSAMLNGADLSGKNLTGVNLTGAKLIGADLTNANLTDADLTDAKLQDADLTGAYTLDDSGNKVPFDAAAIGTELAGGAGGGNASTGSATNPAGTTAPAAKAGTFTIKISGIPGFTSALRLQRELNNLLGDETTLVGKDYSMGISTIKITSTNAEDAKAKLQDYINNANKNRVSDKYNLEIGDTTPAPDAGGTGGGDGGKSTTTTTGEMTPEDRDAAARYKAEEDKRIKEAEKAKAFATESVDRLVKKIIENGGPLPAALLTTELGISEVGRLEKLVSDDNSKNPRLVPTGNGMWNVRDDLKPTRTESTPRTAEQEQAAKDEAARQLAPVNPAEAGYSPKIGEVVTVTADLVSQPVADGPILRVPQERRVGTVIGSRVENGVDQVLVTFPLGNGVGGNVPNRYIPVSQVKAYAERDYPQPIRDDKDFPKPMSAEQIDALNVEGELPPGTPREARTDVVRTAPSEALKEIMASMDEESRGWLSINEEHPEPRRSKEEADAALAAGDTVFRDPGHGGDPTRTNLTKALQDLRKTGATDDSGKRGTEWTIEKDFRRFYAALENNMPSLASAYAQAFWGQSGGTAYALGRMIASALPSAEVSPTNPGFRPQTLAKGFRNKQREAVSTAMMALDMLKSNGTLSDSAYNNAKTNFIDGFRITRNNEAQRDYGIQGGGNIISALYQVYKIGPAALTTEKKIADLPWSKELRTNLEEQSNIQKSIEKEISESISENKRNELRTILADGGMYEVVTDGKTNMVEYSGNDNLNAMGKSDLGEKSRENARREEAAKEIIDAFKFDVRAKDVAESTWASIAIEALNDKIIMRALTAKDSQVLDSSNRDGVRKTGLSVALILDLFEKTNPTPEERTSIIQKFSELFTADGKTPAAEIKRAINILGGKNETKAKQLLASIDVYRDNLRKVIEQKLVEDYQNHIRRLPGAGESVKIIRADGPAGADGKATTVTDDVKVISVNPITGVVKVEYADKTEGFYKSPKDSVPVLTNEDGTLEGTLIKVVKPKKESVAVGTVTGKGKDIIDTMTRRRTATAPNVGAVLAEAAAGDRVYPTKEQIDSMSIRDFGKYITNIVNSGRKDLIDIFVKGIYPKSDIAGYTALPAGRLMGAETIAIAAYLENGRYAPILKEISDAFNLLSSNSGKKKGKSISDLLSSPDKIKAAVAKFEKQIKDAVEKGTMTDAKYATAQRKAVTEAKTLLLSGVRENWKAYLGLEENMNKGGATETPEARAAAQRQTREETGTAIEGDITQGTFAGINLGTPVIDGSTMTFPLTIPEGMVLRGIVASFRAAMNPLLKNGATIRIVVPSTVTASADGTGSTGSRLVIYNLDTASSDLIKDNPRKALAEIINGSKTEEPASTEPRKRGRPKRVAPVVEEVLKEEVVADDTDMLATIAEWNAEDDIDSLLTDLDDEVEGDGEKALELLNEYKIEKLEEFKDHLDNADVITQMKFIDKMIGTFDLLLAPDKETDAEQTEGERIAEEVKVEGEVAKLDPVVREAVKVTKDNPFFKDFVKLTRVTLFNNGSYKGVKKIDKLTGLVNEWIEKGEKASAEAIDIVGLMQSATAEQILPVILLSHEKTKMTDAFLKVVDGDVGKRLIELIDAQKISTARDTSTTTAPKPVTLSTPLDAAAEAARVKAEADAAAATTAPKPADGSGAATPPAGAASTTPKAKRVRNIRPKPADGTATATTAPKPADGSGAATPPATGGSGAPKPADGTKPAGGAGGSAAKPAGSRAAKPAAEMPVPLAAPQADINDVVDYINSKQTKGKVVSITQKNIIEAILNHEPATPQLLANYTDLAARTVSGFIATLRDFGIVSQQKGSDGKFLKDSDGNFYYEFNPGYSGAVTGAAATGATGVTAPDAAGSGGAATSGGATNGSGSVTPPAGGGVIGPPNWGAPPPPRGKGNPALQTVSNGDPGFMDYMKAWRNAALLSNPIGIVMDATNAVLNGLVINTARNYVTAGVESVAFKLMKLKQEDRTMTLQMANDYTKALFYTKRDLGSLNSAQANSAILRGMGDSLNALVRPRDYLDASSENFTLLSDAKNPVLSTLGTAFEMGSRLRIASDAFAVGMVRQALIAMHAKAGVRNFQLTSGTQSIAQSIAVENQIYDDYTKAIWIAMNPEITDAANLPSTFNPGDFSRLSQDQYQTKAKEILNQSLNTVYRGKMTEMDFGTRKLRSSQPVLQFVIPFLQTMSRIAYAGADMVPILGQGLLARDLAKGKYGGNTGIGNLATNFKQGFTARGELTTDTNGVTTGKEADRQLLSQRIAMQTIGLTAVMSGVALAAVGALTGPGPDDPEERSRWLDEGNRPYNLKIGKTSISITGALGPLAWPLMFGAMMHDRVTGSSASAAKREQDISEMFGSFLKTSGTYLYNNTAMRNLGEFLSAIQGKEASDVAQRFASGSMLSFHPYSGLARYIARSDDPYMRNPNTVAEYVYSQLPVMEREFIGNATGANTKVPIKMTEVGLDIKKTDAERNFFLPVNISSEKNNAPYRLIKSTNAREDYVNNKALQEVVAFTTGKSQIRPTAAQYKIVSEMISSGNKANPAFKAAMEALKPKRAAATAERVNQSR